MNRPQLFARLILAGIGLLVLTLALAFAGCASHRPGPAPMPSRIPVTQQVPGQQRPEKLPPVPNHASAGLLSGLGNVFSTPQGRANRQAVRLARAAVPRSIGKGAVYAINSKVAAGYKPKAAVVNADSGATVSNAAANAQQQTVKGNGNKLQAKQANPTTEAPGPLAVIANNLTGWIPWALGAALVLAVVFRKRLPLIGPFFA